MNAVGSKQAAVGKSLVQKIDETRRAVYFCESCIRCIEHELWRYMADLYRLEFTGKRVAVFRYQRLQNRIDRLNALIRDYVEQREKFAAKLDQYIKQAQQEIDSLPTVRLFGF